MVESGVNSNVIFSFIGYGPIRSIGELTTCYRGSTTRDQPACQVGLDQCCQETDLHDRAGQGFMKTGEVINPRISENRGSADQHF